MDERAIWEELVSAAWIRHADVIDAHSKPFGDAAADALALSPGESVIDVGCGTGATTLRLAERVGIGGRAVGLDLSGPAIEHARARAAQVPNVEFVVGDASSVAIDLRFDALYSRNGVMFFADPVAAFAHLRSLMAEGGRLAFTCWKDPFSNPWLSVPVIASASVLGPPDLPGPGKPGPFAFASDDVIHGTLTGAGWSHVEATELSVEDPYGVGDSAATAAVMVELMPPLAAGLARAPELREDLVEAVADAVQPFERGGDVVMQATAWIVTANA